MAGPTLVVLIKTARRSSVTTIRELRKDKAYCSQVPEGARPPRGHTARGGGREGERARDRADLGFCLYWSRGLEDLGFQVFTLYW